MKLKIARPQLGNPLILTPGDLINGFEITVAGRLEVGDESNIPIPNKNQVEEFLRQNKPKIVIRGKEIDLNVVSIGTVFKHPEFTTNYADTIFAQTNAQQQYEGYFRWDVKVRVRVDKTQLDPLNITWPTFIDLKMQDYNAHAIYVDETLSKSNEFTILQITDLHISRRNDLMPEILSQTRNQGECNALRERYVNPNDNLRAFIKLANDRVRSGEKIIVVATGDLVDNYADGWWDGRFILGQGGGNAPDRMKDAYGSSWGYSNTHKFKEIVLGLDGKGEELLCPIFTIPGNHDYLPNEVPLSLKVDFDAFFFKYNLLQRFSFESYGLLKAEAREYDRCTFEGAKGEYASIFVRKTFKENINADGWAPSLDHDWGYWLAKPKSWILSQYTYDINYDTDFKIKIGDQQLIFLNTGADRYPRQEEFARIESKEEEDRDYIEGGPHNRGIVDYHITMLNNVMSEPNEKGMILIFTHAPIIGMEKDKTDGIQALYEEEHAKDPTAATPWLTDLFASYKANYYDLASNGFSFDKTRYFKKGKRDPYINFSCADGKWPEFLHKISRVMGTETNKPVLVFSGHTHKVHEFRIERMDKPLSESNFYYFTDDYSGKVFINTDKKAALLLRYAWLKNYSPLLVTSGALKLKKPQYREIKVAGQSLYSLEMKTVPSVPKTANFRPGCRLVALKGCNGLYVSVTADNDPLVKARSIGPGETFELNQLEDGNVIFKAASGQSLIADMASGGKVKLRKSSENGIFKLVGIGPGQTAIRAKNGNYLCAEGGGGRELVANRKNAAAWETFTLVELEKAGQIVIESLNYPNYYIRHRNYLGELTKVSTDLDKMDASFRIVPGLAKQKYPLLQREYISLQSVNFPGFYLGQINNVFGIHKYSDDVTFKNGATFRLRLGLADRNGASFESFNLPGYYIRHKNFKLFVEKGSGDLFAKDATFRILDSPWK